MPVLIYLHRNQLRPAGGPLGVGYYIYEEVNNRGIQDDVCFLENKETVKDKFFYPLVKSIMRMFPFLDKTLRALKKISQYKKIFSSNATSKINNIEKFNAIHFHSTIDLYREREKLANYKGKIILSSHSPVPAFLEIEDSCETKLETIWYKKNKEKFIDIDRFAFQRADYIVFPTEGALEPYLNHWDEFKRIIKDKYLLYLPTGISERKAKIRSDQIRRKLKLKKDDFVISFAGRHNSTKGFDLLKEIAIKLFELDSQIKVISMGEEHPILRLNHQSWVELGFMKDPYSYIRASDLLIVPNRETYFDLVILEALSLGKIVLTTRTGGNRYYQEHQVGGVYFFSTIEEAINLIHKIKSFSEKERELLGLANKTFFYKNLTSRQYMDSYLSALRSIGINK